MKKYIKWGGIVLASPVILFIILCILIYIPPVQNFIVDKAASYASQATGMHIHIQRISLSFPLNLVVHETSVTDQKDTLLNVEELTVKIQLLPLIKKQIEVDGVGLKNASVHTGNLIDGMSLQGKLGELFLKSHGVDLTPETAVLNELTLKNADLKMCLADTTAQDTTQSTPTFWKFDLRKIDLSNVKFQMDMPLDTLNFGIHIKNASLRNGFIDLHKEAYSVRTFKLLNSQMFYNSGNSAPQEKGLDPSHIALSDINLQLDSLYYQGNNIRALLHQFELKERSGLEITSSEGRLQADEKAIRIPALQIKTANSFLAFNATIDWSVTEQNQDGTLSGQLMAEIGKGDLFKLLPDMPEKFVQEFPSAPLQIRIGINGDLNNLQLKTCQIKITDYFRMEANGTVKHLLDSISREATVQLNSDFYRMNFLESLTGGILIPQGTKFQGKAQMKGNDLQAKAQLNPGEGLVELDGKFNLLEEAYQADLHINELNLHKFMPTDSLFGLSAHANIEGKGFDFFSPHTLLKADAGLDHLQWGSRILSGVQLQANLKASQAGINLNVKDNAMQISSQLNALLHPSRIKADGQIQVGGIDLYDMGLTASPLKTMGNVDLHLHTDMKRNHGLQVSVTHIQLLTESQTYKTKDLHVGFNTARDSIRSYVNAGDLTFLFRSRGGIDELGNQITHLTHALNMQWKQKHIDQAVLKKLLPDARLRIFAGKDNPISNALSIRKINFDRMNVDVQTSPENGLNAAMNLYGLRTDSLAFDTIYFQAIQQAENIKLSSGVIANDKPFQEAFDITLNGEIEADKINTTIEYLNGKKECGVNIGMTAGLQKGGISLHIAPFDPILVYRKFTVNPNNYIYLRDDGRIMADLSIHDEMQTGLTLYSTPDSTAQQDLTLTLSQINIGEFKRVIPYMPDISGIINAEAHYVQTGQTDMISLENSVDQLAYNGIALGDWTLSAVYLPKQSGEQSINGFITRNKQEIASIDGSYFPSDEGDNNDRINANMNLHHFPLEIANSFIPGRMATLSGDIDGTMKVSGSSASPLMNGQINLDSVNIYIPQASMNLRFDDRPVEVKDSKLLFNRFKIFTKGKTPFTIDGNVDMADFSQMKMDLKMDANNFELLNAKQTKQSLVFGKLYVDFHSTLKGTPDDMSIRGNMNILGNSDFTYILQDSPLTVEDKLGETVTFMNFSDTTSVNRRILPALSLGGIDMLMTLHIDEGVQCRVNMDEKGSNYMYFEGGGDLSFQYTQEGNIILSGKYSLLSGEMKYQLPIIPLKTFYIQGGSYIQWSGNAMNPLLNIKATERVRSSVAQEGQASRMVNFDVGVNITNTLEDLGFTFIIDAPEDGTMQNELASMSTEEKNKVAVTMLVTGMYLTEGGTLGGGGGSSVMNSFLQDQISKVAGSALKTIDVNFGIETNNGEEAGQSSTDYNFQFAKRFWNNRIRVVIGGKVSTGNNVQQDDSFIDNISLEYRLDNSGTRYVKLFHDKNYESILDGEVIETGAGIVLRKKVSKVGELFIFRRKKKAPVEAEKKEEDENENETPNN